MDLEQVQIMDYLKLSQFNQKKKIIYEGGPTQLEYIVNDAAKSSVDILSSKFANKSIILKGEYPIHMKDLLKTVSEILGSFILKS